MQFPVSTSGAIQMLICVALVGGLSANVASAKVTVAEIKGASRSQNGPIGAPPTTVIVVAENDKNSKDEAAAESLPLPPTTPVELSPAEQYCSNVIDAATAAQLAQQTSNLEKAQKQLDDRIALLASRTEELKAWIKKREDFTAHATESLVQIYSKMKPDAAAKQLTEMDEIVASAIMSKLSPKVSSLIMGEMEAARAARVSAIIAGAGEVQLKPDQTKPDQIKPERKADAQQ
jgi:flagellar motility protein MotE (MotC chaperone)